MHNSHKASKIQILYIDDEPNNLISFKATFRTDYHVFLAETTAEGYAILKKNPGIQVVLCDQLMPEETGVQFFERLAAEFPDLVRMLISGYTDMDSMIKAINHGHIYQFIQKPWHESQLRAAIEDGSHYYDTTVKLAQRNKALQQAYEDAGQLTYRIIWEAHTSILSLLDTIGNAEQAVNNEGAGKLLSLLTEVLEQTSSYLVNMHECYNLIRMGETPKTTAV